MGGFGGGSVFIGGFWKKSFIAKIAICVFGMKSRFGKIGIFGWGADLGFFENLLGLGIFGCN